MHDEPICVYMRSRCAVNGLGRDAEHFMAGLSDVIDTTPALRSKDEAA
jgi:hypothetical protein